MADLDKLINTKVCKFYSGDPNQCIKNLPVVKIKIVLSILIILLGILIIAKSPDFIIKAITNLFKNFAKLIGLIFIVTGSMVLNNSLNSIIS